MKPKVERDASKTDALQTPTKKLKKTESRTRTRTVPTVETPSIKKKKAQMMPPGSAVKNTDQKPKVQSAKKPGKPSWKRPPPHAHSGVPVPEKMRQMIMKMSENFDDSL